MMVYSSFLEALVHLKDSTVVGMTLEGYECCFLRVFNELGNRGLKLSLDKCKFSHASLINFTYSITRESEKPLKISLIWSINHVTTYV